MGWGTLFNTEIYLSREMYSSQFEVEEKLAEIDKHLNVLISSIKMFATASPSEIIPEDWKDEPVNWLNNKIDELIDSYDELMIQQFRLTLYLEHIKENPENKMESEHV